MATEVRRLIDEGAARLVRVADDPLREAELLLAAALGRDRAWLHGHADEQVLDCDATDRFEAYLTRRSLGEPVAYILGVKEFWSLGLAVTPDVLVPRPETELVVERVLARVPAGATGRVLDLATGSGAIALAVAHERQGCTVLGTDLSEAAVALATANARRLGLANASFRVGSWYAPVAGERFDAIACNPPYVAEADPELDWQVRRFEPPQALYAGRSGLEALETVIAGAATHLRPGGWLVLEHGATQGPAVRDLLRAAGLREIAGRADLRGLDRCTEGRSATGLRSADAVRRP